MQKSCANNVKIYNLTAGKSLPDWLSDEKKRKLQKSDKDVQKRIELIQDFEMPSYSSCVRMSHDRKYVCATGTYKPRLRCYDLQQLTIKFERGLDAEVVKFMFLEEDYGKMLLMQDDRHIELHTQCGRHHRFRIPKFGRDLAYYSPTCNAYFVGASSDVYRMNLETGQFQAPLSTNASEILCCEFNPQHYLFACGTKEGAVEFWDPRDRTRASILDITKSSFTDLHTLPAVTALKYRDGLNLAVGTSTGHVLLYDIRNGMPVRVKDHHYDLPIKDLAFHHPLDLVLSMDSKVLRLWDRNTGKPYTSIEPESNLNSMCLVPESGLVFMANEAPKILTYYIPSLGTAPRWCSFLDTITEELEESEHQTVYDDYKFVTRRELEELGLSQYIGSNLLRAYMHGYFMDIRLYKKFKSIAQPFSYEQFRKDQVRKKIDEQTENQFRIVKRKLPSVNKDLAYRLQQEAEQMAAGELSKKKSKKRAVAGELLEDDRFGALFKDKDFQIDNTSEEYRLLNPVMAKLDAKRKNELSLLDKFDQVDSEEEGVEGRPSEESSSSSSSEDEEEAEETAKPTPKKGRAVLEAKKKHAPAPQATPKFFEVKEGEHLRSLKDKKRKMVKKTLAERVEAEGDEGNWSAIGNKEMTYRMKKSFKEEDSERQQQEHKGERRKVRRSATEISKQIKAKPKYWMGQRVK